MENVLNYLANDIVEKIESYLPLNIKEDMNNFMNSSISIKKKEKVLELLYLLQLYGHAFISVDPRGKNRLLSCVNSILKSKSDSEVTKQIKTLKYTVKLFEKAETHPLISVKNMLEEKEKTKDIEL